MDGCYSQPYFCTTLHKQTYFITGKENILNNTQQNVKKKDTFVCSFFVGRWNSVAKRQE